jgi:hypothetical protein
MSFISHGAEEATECGPGYGTMSPGPTVVLSEDNSCLGPLFLISRSPINQGLEEPRNTSTELGPVFQDFNPAGFSIGPWAPQELIASRITVGDLAVL